MRMKLALQLSVVFSFFGSKGVELQRMAVDKSRIHQENTIGQTFRQRERRLKDYDLNGPGSLSPILERLESFCREWCSLMRRWRGGDVWGWKEKEKEKARRGRRLISRDTTSSNPQALVLPILLDQAAHDVSSNFRLHTQLRPLEKITSLSCSSAHSYSSSTF